MEELWTMSRKEWERAGVMTRLEERRLSQEAAAEALGVSVRQVRRLLRAYEVQGAAGVASKRRGKPSNRKFADDLQERVVGLVRAHYYCFDRARVFVSGFSTGAWETHMLGSSGALPRAHPASKRCEPQRSWLPRMRPERPNRRRIVRCSRCLLALRDHSRGPGATV